MAEQTQQTSASQASTQALQSREAVNSVDLYL
jgi:hypothetical protein